MTVAFRFRFDSLLRLRESQRDEARQAVADGLQALGILEGQRADIEAQREQLRVDAQRSLSTPVISADVLLNRGRYDLQLAAGIQNIDTNCAKVKTEIERRQSLLQAADIEVKRLERLRDFQHQQWTVEQQTKQQAELDEIAVLRFARSQSKAGVDRWE